MWWQILLCSLFSISDGHLVELNRQEYHNYIYEGQWIQPGCIYTRNVTVNVKNSLKRFERNLKKLDLLLFLVKYQDEMMLPSNVDVICFTRKLSPVHLRLQDVGNYKQLKSALDTPFMALRIAGGNTFDRLLHSAVKTLVVYLPGQQLTERGGREEEEKLEELLLSDDENFDELLFVPPDTEIEREYVQRYEVYDLPAILIYSREYRHQRFALTASLQGRLQGTIEHARLQLLLLKMREFHFSASQLTSSFTSPSSVFLLCVYTLEHLSSFHFLHAFERSVRSFQNETFKFAVADIINQKIATALMLLLKLNDGVPNIPFLLVVDRGGDQQQVFPPSLVPTPHVLEIYLQSLGLLNKTNTETSSFYDVCSANYTDVCFPGDKPVKVNIKIEVKEKVRKVRKAPSLYLTEKTWLNVFSQRNKKPALGMSVHVKSKNVLVIYIQADCSFCDLSMSVFKKVHKAQKYLDSTSVYLMNCTSDRQYCRKYNIIGFPTLVLFRLPTSATCFYGAQEMNRIDYHGDIEVVAILAWLSSMNHNPVQILENGEHKTLKKDVQLTAKLYTKSYMKRYLPRHLHGRLVPYNCFIALCELFYMQVECVAAQASGVRLEESDRVLYLESLQFHRRDNVSATIFQTGFFLKHTMMSEEKRQNVFHSPHRYGISNAFKCEDDYVTCNDVMLAFVKDHSRLPVTSLFPNMLHSHQDSVKFLREKPLLVALVHASNITYDSAFYQQLYRLAVNVYNDVTVATIDADEHADWANLFVPRDYYNTPFQEEEPPLHKYPRFCIVELQRHNRAAFYPRLSADPKTTNMTHVVGNLDISLLMDFINEYLNGKDDLVVETFQF